MKYFILENGGYAVGKYVPEGATIIDKPSHHQHILGTDQSGYLTDLVLNKV